MQAQALKSAAATTSSRNVAKKVVDFFGINNITNKELAGCYKSATSLPPDAIDEKYQPLLQKRNKPANELTEEDRVFGHVQFDVHNKPKFHGQFEPSSEETTYQPQDIKNLYLPGNERIKKNHNVRGDRRHSNSDEGKPVPTTDDSCKQYGPTYRISELQPVIELPKVLNVLNVRKQNVKEFHETNQPPLSFKFDRPYISRAMITELKYKLRYNQLVREAQSADEDEEDQSSKEAQGIHKNHEMSSETGNPDAHTDTGDPKDRLAMLETLDEAFREKMILETQLDLESQEEIEKDTESLAGSRFDQSLDRLADVPEAESTTVAADYIKQIRSRRIEPTAKGLKHRLQNENPYPTVPHIKLDSLGFNNYEYIVPQWHLCTRNDVKSFVEKSILYHNYDVLVVNKPYGIHSHPKDMTDRRDGDYDVDSLMQEIVKKRGLDKAYLVHRIDKTTTGTLIFTTNKELATKLQKYLASDQIVKTYLCLVKGAPEIEHAKIDIPIGEFKLAGKIRMCVAPENVPDEFQYCQNWKLARNAVTEYKLLERTDHISLLEVKTHTGIKHQIRCHLAFGLGTPILGDHKYDRVTRIAPQDLPKPVLKLLHIRAQKVRTLPIFLHASNVVIPNVKANGEPLHVSAPLPYHFRTVLKKLHLRYANL